ncbi:GtrA family protein [Paenibacillus sp. 32352]|uniref:GtrA family protein n=1 Tax=Paenibacillus sp. 32352 TaxID=1969111 RepID=UPI0009AD1472
MVKWIKQNFHQLFRFGLVGIVSTCCHVGLLALLVEKLRIQTTFASAAGFILAVLVSFIFNSVWTFKDNSTKKNVNINLFWKYSVVCIVGLCINTFIFFICNDIFRIWYVASQIIVVFFVTPSNFLLNKYWTYKKIN